MSFSILILYVLLIYKIFTSIVSCFIGCTETFETFNIDVVFCNSVGMILSKLSREIFTPLSFSKNKNVCSLIV